VDPRPFGSASGGRSGRSTSTKARQGRVLLGEVGAGNSESAFYEVMKQVLLPHLEYHHHHHHHRGHHQPALPVPPPAPHPPCFCPHSDPHPPLFALFCGNQHTQRLSFFQPKSGAGFRQLPRQAGESEWLFQVR